MYTLEQPLKLVTVPVVHDWLESNSACSDPASIRALADDGKMEEIGSMFYNAGSCGLAANENVTTALLSNSRWTLPNTHGIDKIAARVSILFKYSPESIIDSFGDVANGQTSRIDKEEWRFEFGVFVTPSSLSLELVTFG